MNNKIEETIESLRIERDEYRQALMECLRNAGGGCTDRISKEFLLTVPEEVKLLKQHRDLLLKRFGNE